jgi:hypothetical protein
VATWLHSLEGVDMIDLIVRYSPRFFRENLTAVAWQKRCLGIYTTKKAMLKNRDMQEEEDRFGLETNKSRFDCKEPPVGYLPALRSMCACKMQGVLSTTHMYTLQCSYVLLRMKVSIPTRLAGGGVIKKILYIHHIDERSRSRLSIGRLPW